MKYLELRSGLDLSATGLRVAPALQESFRQVIPQGLGGRAAVRPRRFLEFLPDVLHPARPLHLGAPVVPRLPVRLQPGVAAALPRACVAPAPAGASRAAPGSTRRSCRSSWSSWSCARIWPGIQNLYDDWANVAYYSTYLIAGFLLAWSPALERRRRRASGAARSRSAAPPRSMLLLAVLRRATRRQRCHPRRLGGRRLVLGGRARRRGARVRAPATRRRTSSSRRCRSTSCTSPRSSSSATSSCCRCHSACGRSSSSWCWRRWP